MVAFGFMDISNDRANPRSNSVMNIILVIRSRTVLKVVLDFVPSSLFREIGKFIEDEPNPIWLAVRSNLLIRFAVIPKLLLFKVDVVSTLMVETNMVWWRVWWRRDR